MNACVETIQENYILVNKQAEHMSTLDIDIDDFLDQINAVRLPLIKLTNDINNFIELVRSYFVELSSSDSEKFLKEFVVTRQLMIQCYNKLRACDLYVGMKQAVKNYRDSIELFSEMCRDLEDYNIKLERDPEYKDLVEKLNAIA